MIKDNCNYQIKLRGQVSSDEINAMSPITLVVEQAEADETLLSFCTDQSGLVGVLSYLHGQGLIFLAILRQERLD